MIRTEAQSCIGEVLSYVEPADYAGRNRIYYMRWSRASPFHALTEYLLVKEEGGAS
jgi:hypothetical protein